MSRRTKRALAELVREARSEPVPDVDWAALEERLPSGPLPRAPQRSAWKGALLAAAAVGLLAGVWIRLTQNDERQPVAHDHHAEVVVGPTNGDLLAPGTQIAAETRPRRVEHARRASWTLAAGGRATLVATGEVVVVRLESGSLSAEIVPSSRAETFVVEAADVRVAVHGTVFRVTLAGDNVAVSVAEGSVLVGPRRTPGVGQRLQGPADGRFSLHGQPLVEDTTETTLEERTQPRAQRTAPSAHASATASAVASVAPSETPELPEHPPVEAVEKAAAAAVELASSCFRQRTVASDGVRVTAQTQVTLRALGDGSVGAIGFEPPLAPNVQACVAEGTAKIRLPESQNGFQVSRKVELER